MDPSIVPGVRREFTSLDWAGLADIGWSVDQLAVTIQPPSSVPVGTGFGLSVSAEDPDGLVDTTFTGSAADTVNLALATNPGGATLASLAPGGLAVQAINGVATFTGLTLNSAGAGYTIGATSGTLVPATSSAVTITPAPATTLLVTTPPPANVSASGGFNLAVSAEDSFGDLDTNYSGFVTLSLVTNPGNATLGGTTTVQAMGGVATFNNLTLGNPAMGYQIQATALNTAQTANLAPATTTPFNVLASKATKLVPVTPTVPVTAGQGFSLSVMAEDSSGNVDTSFNGPVFLPRSSTANPGGSTLGGTLSATFANGVATFNGLTLNKAAVGYRLAAVSGNLTAGLTGAFTVVAAPATQLVLVTQPPLTTAATRLRGDRLRRGCQRKPGHDLQRPGNGLAFSQPGWLPRWAVRRPRRPVAAR